MTLNPEFRRNLWLEAGASRLGVVLLGLAAVLVLIYVNDGFGSTFVSATSVIYFLMVMVWGGRLGADAVAQEINDRTWDGQRMSGLGPWAMTWGKLFGATIVPWVAGAVCLAGMAAGQAEMRRPDWSQFLQEAVAFVLLGILCHAVAMAMSLQSIRKGRQAGRVRTLFFQLVGLLAAGAGYWIAARLGTFLAPDTSVHWFSLVFPARPFALASLAIFTAWAILAAYRLMRQELQVPTTPLAWTAFLAFAVLYLSGLIMGGITLPRWIFNDRLGELPSGSVDVAAFGAYALLTGLIYIAIFTEPKDLVAMRRGLAALRRGALLRAWMQTPRWLVTLAFALAALLVCLALSGRYAIDPRFRQYGEQFLVSTYLFDLRNVGIVLLCGLALKGQRGDLTAIVILATLSVLVPLIALSAGAGQLATWLMPRAGMSWSAAIVPVAIQIVLVYGLVARLWMRSDRLRLAGA